MKIILIIIVILISAFYIYPQDKTGINKVAITFDDYPLSRLSHFTYEESGEIIGRLIDNISKSNIPAIAFVNENKLLTNGEFDSLKIKFLIDWLNAGLDLGNHTFSHPDLNKVSPEEFKRDIMNGEQITGQLKAEKGKRITYFRHPYLHTGMTEEIKENINNFLSENGYIIAPVTIDNSESMYALAFDNVMDTGDTTLAVKVAEEYIEYLNKMFDYFEKQSVDIFGRNINHILLLHSNQLNSFYIEEICQMIYKRGYKISSLEEVLTDPVYVSEDLYCGKKGISWIQRWAVYLGKTENNFQQEPEPSDFIKKLTNKK
jgi:peptidoglycan/xylan/chitin deacetylase (PgdA/CDA1 family)